MKLKAVILSAVLAASMFGCGTPKSIRGGYTFAICGHDYIAFHAEVVKDEIVLTDLNSAPGLIQHLKKPVHLKYLGRKNGLSLFQMTTDDGQYTAVMSLHVVEGNLVGSVLWSDGDTQKVVAVKGSVANLTAQGKAGFMACVNSQERGEGDPAQPDGTA
jgi:hypothetical protein